MKQRLVQPTGPNVNALIEVDLFFIAVILADGRKVVGGLVEPPPFRLLLVIVVEPILQRAHVDPHFRPQPVEVLKAATLPSRLQLEWLHHLGGERHGVRVQEVLLL